MSRTLAIPGVGPVKVSPTNLALGAAAVAGVAWWMFGSSKRPSQPTWPIVDPANTNVPVYGGDGSGRAFGADRPASDVCGGGLRTHGGIDLSASRGQRVVAVESGVIAATQGWEGPSAKALLLQTDSGPVALYGALAPGSWSEFGVSKGSRVKQGQVIGRIGMYPAGSSMLHFELYAKGATKNRVWCKGDPRPPGMLDPTAYLRRAAARVIR